MCRFAELEVERGATALVHGQALAIFRTQDDQVYVLGNHDPFAKASNLARGIVGVRGGRPLRRLAHAQARLRPAQRPLPRRPARVRPGVRRPRGRRRRAGRAPQARRRGLGRLRGRPDPAPAPSRSRPRPRPGRSARARRWSSPRPTPARPSAADRAASASARRGPEPRPVADHLDRDVADREAGGPDPPGGLAEQGRAGGTGPLRLRRAEVGAQVAQPGRREQRVARGVGGDVGVGVPLETLRLVGPGEPGEVERVRRRRAGARRCRHRLGGVVPRDDHA